MEPKNSAKYLGILIDYKLSWKDQIGSALCKVRQGAGLMKKLSYLATYPVCCFLYYSFTECHMQYGITTWGSPVTKGLCKIQNIIDKIVLKINKCKPADQNSIKPLNINNLWQNDIPTPLRISI